ncbi:MAG: hypothetical protein CL903_03315 [Dehalococcoidia bacterium]|nr:hypothetical protein [Dehalococcoidia bacterium]MQG09047.1 undecaprenyl-diphosphate phosphatase [SAR202 cluster bacterium]|tara:strand:- start:8491 stop:9303 length:813 start_codon:yes stop_codon:yes gene_type:complete
MSLLEIIILSIIQGITEFLPVSSTGHIIFFSDLFDIDTTDIYFDITVHLGSLLSIICYFRKNIFEFFKFNNKFYVQNLVYEISYKKLCTIIILSTLPIVICVLFFDLEFFQKFRSSAWVGIFMIFTSFILFISEFLSSKNKHLGEISRKDSIIIGIFQCISIFPGVSRSGITIFSGLLVGMDRQSAVVYSFILSIPTILGAVCLMLINNINDLNFENIFIKFIIPTFLSFIFSYIAIAFIIRYLKNGTFKPFVIYCFFSGIFLLTTNILR